MKILYLYQHFVLPEKAGITRTYEFARRLCAQGHEVHLIASDERLDPLSLSPYTTLQSGIHVHWLPIPYNNRMPFLKRIIAFSKYMIGAFKKGFSLDFDLVYVSSPPLTSTLPAAILARLRRVPLVLEVRDLWPDLPIVFNALRDPFSKRIAKWMELFAYRQATHVIALSPGIRAAITSRGVSPTAITLVPNCCDIDNFSVSTPEEIRLPANIKDSDFVVLYPGTLGVANGISYIVNLANELKESHPQIKFLLVGDGKEKQRIRSLAAQGGTLDQNLFLMDPVPKKDIPALFRRATLIINTLVSHTSLWNSSPNKFFDALAASKPIAINFEGWLAELIEEYKIGLVLDAHDTKKAAQQLAEAFSNPLWLENAGRNAFQLGEKEFNRDKLANRLNQALMKLVPHLNGSSIETQPKKSA